MIKYTLRQNKREGSTTYGKWYAFPVIDQTMDLAALAKHLSEHDSGFSEAICYGVIKAMVKCIKEQMLEGKNVKLDGLAIFSVGIKNAQGGAETTQDFSASKNIERVKFRARATGQLTSQKLDLEATLKRASYTTV